MPHAPTSKLPKPSDQEPIPKPTVKAPEADSTSQAIVDEIKRLSPKERRALELLVMSRRRAADQAEEEEKRRLQDENFMIDTAARYLTGLPVGSSPAEKRHLIKHHLQEFFAALPSPPGLDAPAKEALLHEALTMLLKVGPKDDVERMMLIQLISSHMASMTCFARASAAATSPEFAAQAMSQAQKMSRLFLDIERAFRQRRKELGRTESRDSKIDLKHLARYILFKLAGEGIFLNDEDVST